MRRADDGIAGHAELAEALVIGQNDDDIRFAWLSGMDGGKQAAEEKEGDERFHEG